LDERGASGYLEDRGKVTESKVKYYEYNEAEGSINDDRPHDRFGKNNSYVLCFFGCVIALVKEVLAITFRGNIHIYVAESKPINNITIVKIPTSAKVPLLFYPLLLLKVVNTSLVLARGVSV
jgi:hypothetical protein